jgi:calcineurin-like phosphoesterase
VAHGDTRLSGTLLEVDTATGKAVSIERLCVHQSELPELESLAASDS